MITLSVRTDTSITSLALYRGRKQLIADEWESGRTLATNLLSHITVLFKQAELRLTDLNGIVCYEGPGSFTGLRIGFTVANTLAYGLEVPITATHGENWALDGVDLLASHKSSKMVLPLYGSEAHITL